MSSFAPPNQPDSSRPDESRPAQSSARCAVSGPRGDINQALQKALEDPLLASTLAIGFKEPISTIKLVADRSQNVGLAIRNNELSIKFPDRIRETSETLHAIVKQLYAHAALELLHQNLTSFVQEGTLPARTLPDIKPLLERFNRSEVGSSREAAEIIRVMTKADSERLLTKGEKIVKKLQQTPLGRLLSATEASERIESIGTLSAQLLALHIITESALPSADKQRRDSLVSIEKAITQIIDSIYALSPAVFYQGNGHTILERYQQAQRRFSFPGFNAPTPDLLEPGKQAAIFQPIQGPLLTTQLQPNSDRFRPIILRRLPTLIACSSASVKLEHELRNWSTTDPNPFGFLQERLLDVIRDVPAALKEVRTNLPTELPKPLTELLESVCLLRLHGGEEGLGHFASLACRFSDRERTELYKMRTALVEAMAHGDASTIAPCKERLQSFLVGLTQEHASDYQALVDFLATWSLCKRPEERADLFNRNNAYFSGLTISLLITITKGLEDYFRVAVSEQQPLPDILLGQFLEDAKGLAQAGVDLENPMVSEYIAPVTASLQDLTTAMRIQLMPRDRQLAQLATVREILARQREQLGRLPSPLPPAAASVPSFTELVISVAQSLHTDLESEVTKQAKTISDSLQLAVDAGDFDSVAPAITAAVSALPALKGTEAYKPLIDLINRSTISWINDIGTSLTDLTAALSNQLREDSRNNDIIVTAVASLRWHLKLAQDIRTIFSGNEFPDRAPRINHVNFVVQKAREQFSTTLLADEDRFVRLATSLLDKLKNSRDQELLADVRELAAMPIITSNLKNRHVREVFEALRARVSQS